MESNRSLIILACIGIYMLFCGAIGVWAMKRTRSTRDFFMAGRNLGIFVLGLAVFSSSLSGFGFIGGPGLVYRMGMSSIWLIVISALGYSFSFYIVGKRLRYFAELCESISLPDLIAARYSSETSRFLAAVTILIGVVGYLAAQILAMAEVLRDLFLNTELIGAISMEWCVALSSIVLIFYCVTGGILASVYTDVWQGLVMAVASVLVFITAITAFDGGMTGVATTIMADDREAIGPWGTLGMMACISWIFLFVLGNAGQPHLVTKFMMCRRVQDIKHILTVTFIGFSVCSLLWISIGLVMRALVLTGAHPEIPDADHAAPQFLQYYAHPVLAGIVFAGLFAAIMSTADGFLNVGTAAVIHDIPRALFRKSFENELLGARIVTAIIALAAALVALYSGQDLVALLGVVGWGIFAAALVPVVAIGFNWKRATAAAANAAIISSLLTNLAIRISNRLWDFAIPYRIDPGAISLLVSLILFLGISFLSKPPRLDPDIEMVMDL